MNKIFVTGATGFVGRYCVAELLAKGFEVHAIHRHSIPNIFPSSIHWHQTDLFDSNRINLLIQSIKPSHLLHCAWIATPGIFWQSPENLKYLKASIDLIQFFAEAGGKRALGLGSCAEYDWTKGGTCSESETLLLPQTIYGQSKLATYYAWSAASKIYNLPFAWARLFFPFGPFEPQDKYISAVIRAVLKNEDFPCSHGRQVRDFLHVQDIARALVMLLMSEETGAFNIGSGKPISLREIVGIITKELGGEEKIKFGAKPEQPGEPPVLIADTTRLYEKFAWRPEIDLAAGIKELIRVHSVVK